MLHYLTKRVFLLKFPEKSVDIIKVTMVMTQSRRNGEKNFSHLRRAANRNSETINNLRSIPMGMSAGQARFLMLTAQKSNNEYQAQRITYERLVLARETEDFTKEYNDKINNRTLLFMGNVATESALNYNRKLSYDDITNKFEDGGLGMRLVDSRGRIILSHESQMPAGADPKDYYVDPEMDNPSSLERELRLGNYQIEKRNLVASSDWSDNTMEINWEKVSYNMISQINDVLDTTDDAEAQSVYDGKMRKFQEHDKQLDMRLKQLETEHKALEVEAESVKKVVDKNVETSFKTFNA